MQQCREPPQVAALQWPEMHLHSPGLARTSPDEPQQSYSGQFTTFDDVINLCDVVFPLIERFK